MGARALDNRLTRAAARLVRRVRSTVNILPPTEQRRQTFQSVYTTGVWGAGGPDEFYSGIGSDDEMVEPYARVVRELIGEKRIRTIVDVGCGDFRVGRAIRTPATRYVGVDIVASLIERNRRLFGDAATQFVCLDAVESPFPRAICVF